MAWAGAVEHFRAGVALRQTLRLRAIRTHVGQRLVRRYELEYRESEATWCSRSPAGMRTT